MNRAIFAVAALAAGALLAMTGLAAPRGDAPVVSSLAPLMEKELHWGMTHVEVVDAYNHPTGLFDREYAPRLAKLQPGVDMDELQAERDNRKSNFAHAYSEFLDTPTGYDLTPLKSEYSYNNGEALQKLYKDGKTRFFFYIKDRLWKIYDEVPLGSDGALGGSFQAALTRIAGVLGAPGRVRPGGTQGLEQTTADWQDSATHLRVVDRSSDHLVGLVLEDKRTVANLPSLRTAKAQDPFALDPSIAAITRGGVTDPNAARQQDVDAGARKRK
ncbi:MAG: hypothetical protein ABSC94_02655 [Polyangiaceae bacterium]|jgi:hypothetical protein